jgi:pyruvate/2-oxoglutarate dehydrogenase complex dihydrolipoamide dehydrogenase (E3) component
LLVDKFPLLANNHAKAIDDAEGIVKVMADKETNKVLGVHIMVSKLVKSSMKPCSPCSMEHQVRMFFVVCHTIISQEVVYLFSQPYVVR